MLKRNQANPLTTEQHFNMSTSMNLDLFDLFLHCCVTSLPQTSSITAQFFLFGPPKQEVAKFQYLF